MANAINPQSIIAHLDSVLEHHRRETFMADPEPEEVRGLITRCIAVIERSAPTGSAYARAVDEVLVEEGSPTLGT
jgi:hypothetical protein